MEITDEKLDAACRAYIAHCERFVIYGHGFGADNTPESVVDEGAPDMPTVFGPAPGAREWNQRQAMKAALDAALGGHEQSPKF